MSEAVALQAARWFLLMRSGEASAADQARLQRWRGADAAHEIAWQRAQRLQEQFSDLPPALAVPVLGRGGSVDRRAVLKTVAALLIAPSAGWLAWRTAPVREWLAEHRSGTGETRLVRLGDGTRVWLDTASAFDVAYGPTERLLYLRAGRILIETAPDAVPEGTPGHRPFVVACAHGRLRALGTRFDVRDTDTDRSRLGVMQGAVEVRPAQAPELSVVVLARQQAAFSSRRIDGPRPLEGQADAWGAGRAARARHAPGRFSRRTRALPARRDPLQRRSGVAAHFGRVPAERHRRGAGQPAARLARDGALPHPLLGERGGAGRLNAAAGGRCYNFVCRNVSLSGIWRVKASRNPHNTTPERDHASWLIADSRAAPPAFIPVAAWPMPFKAR
ncbi:FecR domain-containing protein [Achromobacter denitrificans]|uniref:FecR domain-containing protein n=1 Tax=Achromobacter denitrificans TaxID=32002 RepID=UPI001E3BE78A|nr:FecR domain-containing protein [Achromobacter denitrificans]